MPGAAPSACREPGSGLVPSPALSARVRRSCWRRCSAQESTRNVFQVVGWTFEVPKDSPLIRRRRGGGCVRTCASPARNSASCCGSTSYSTVTRIGPESAMVEFWSSRLGVRQWAQGVRSAVASGSLKNRPNPRWRWCRRRPTSAPDEFRFSLPAHPMRRCRRPSLPETPASTLRAREPAPSRERDSERLH